MTTRRRSIPLLAIALLACVAGHATAQDDWPLDPNVKALPELGRMSGLLPPSTNITNAEEFGRMISPVGDVNGDGLADWVLSHRRYDSGLVINKYWEHPLELLLYHGSRNSLPTSTSGKRIGPSEFPSESVLLSSGDWDADGHRDLALSIHIQTDTLNGHTGWDTHTAVIFWGNGSGLFSLTDTTRLSCDAELWLGLSSCESRDLSGDGIDDLVLDTYTGGALTNGRVVRVPRLYVFVGTRGKRWGRDGLDWQPGLRWWSPPGFNGFRIVDQDKDGAMDLVLHANQQFEMTGDVSVLYGTSHSLPDTVNVESIALNAINGKFSIFSDVTGDGVVELLVSCSDGYDGRIRIYAGWPRQRLRQMYGSGNDNPLPGKGWWRRPWAEIWMPEMISSTWSYSGLGLYRLGDANRDEIADTWIYSNNRLLGYTSGAYLDSLADVQIPLVGVTGAVRLGDIDGSGMVTLAIAYGWEVDRPYDGRILYVKTDSSVNAAGWVKRDLPFARSSVTTSSTGETMIVEAYPNPVIDRLHLRWPTASYHKPVRIVVADLLGRQVRSIEAAPGATSALLAFSDLPSGAYIVTINGDGWHSSLTVSHHRE